MKRQGRRSPEQLLRRHVAAVMSRTGIISTGYNGTARGIGTAPKGLPPLQFHRASGTNWRMPVLHGEENAIVQAAIRHRIKDATLYTPSAPVCSRQMIINAGLASSSITRLYHDATARRISAKPRPLPLRPLNAFIPSALTMRQAAPYTGRRQIETQ